METKASFSLAQHCPTGNSRARILAVLFPTAGGTNSCPAPLNMGPCGKLTIYHRTSYKYRRKMGSWSWMHNSYEQLADRWLKCKNNWFFLKKSKTLKWIRTPTSSGNPHPRLFWRSTVFKPKPSLFSWLLTSTHGELLGLFHTLISHKGQSSTPPFPVVQGTCGCQQLITASGRSIGF